MNYFTQKPPIPAVLHVSKNILSKKLSYFKTPALTNAFEACIAKTSRNSSS